MSATVRVPQLCLASAQPRVPCAEGRCRPALAEPTENVVRPKLRSNSDQRQCPTSPVVCSEAAKLIAARAGSRRIAGCAFGSVFPGSRPL